MFAHLFFFFRVVAVALALAFVSAPAAAYNRGPAAPGAPTAFRKLSGEMPDVADVSASRFRISPDGRYAVFVGDLQSDQAFELYSVLLSGGAPVRLSGNLLAGSFTNFKISPDSSRVVYTADQDTAGQRELYSVPIGGPAGAGVKLSGTMVSGGDIGQINGFHEFDISPDSSQVVYIADQQVDGQTEVYSVPIEGPASAGVKLNGPPAPAGRVSEYVLSQDGGHVVYQTFGLVANQVGLYSVPIAGPASASNQLVGIPTPGTGIGHVETTPDGSRVVYVANLTNGGPSEVYSVPITGPVNSGIKLNGALVQDGEASYFYLSPDGSHVVYSADQQVVGQVQIYGVPVGGPAAAGVRLSSVSIPGGRVRGVFFSPDSTRVVFVQDTDAIAHTELFSVPVEGPASAAVKLNGVLPAGAEVTNLEISPDGSRVVYTADQDTAGQRELFSVPIVGPAAAGIKISEPLSTGEIVISMWVSPDSRQVIYVASIASDHYELFRAPIAGPDGSGLSGPINGPLVTGGSVDFTGFFEANPLTPGGGRVIYLADAETDEKYELYLADAGPAEASFPGVTVQAGESAGTVDLTVALSADRVEPAQVNYAVTGGTATAGLDFTLAAGPIIFAPGETQATIPLAILQDSQHEGDETVVVTLSDPQNASLGSAITLTLTIQDDDAAQEGFAVYLPIATR